MKKKYLSITEMHSLQHTKSGRCRISCFLLTLILANYFHLSAQNSEQGKSVPVSVTFSNARFLPVEVPVVPLLGREKPYFDQGVVTIKPVETDYQPSGDGSFIKKNGKSERIFVITTGVWRLLTGDKPIIGIDQRSLGGAYARPGLIPYLGVKGKIRISVNNGKKEKNLEDFTAVTTKLAAGTPQWICEDSDLKLKLILTAYPFSKEFGLALIVQSESQKPQKITLSWHYEDAGFVRDHGNYTEFTWDKYTHIFAGSRGENTTFTNGNGKRNLNLAPGIPVSDTLICVWGYSDYDRAEVDSAYERLRFRPFPSREWTEEMKKNWFHHWIGRGLDPEKKFLSVFNNPEKVISRSKNYWESMRGRISVKTGDDRFDNVVRAIGSRLISDFEYPGYLHGSNYMKYGKINCGHYGHEAAGFHDEVATSLKFMSGTQCVKGRQRYIMPNFRISQWAEEMNPYFIDQVWYHYRWTGDLEFLNDMWPSVRRAIEHYISTSDPDHDGIFTGFYETWNGDAKNRGGKCALSTAQGISVLRNGYNMATILRDVDWTLPGQQNPNPPADNDFRIRYKRLLEKAEAGYKTLYNKKTGAWSSGEWDAPLRNMPENEESSYAIWRETGPMLENYTSMRFIRENYHETTKDGVYEFCNRNWPVCWSNHYFSFSDAMASVAAAAMVNDMNHYWPLLKYASEGVYTRPECTVVAGGGSQLSLESDQMFMMAVLDNVFGIKPNFGENLLRIRPSFPDSWKNPEIAIPDVAFKYLVENNYIDLTVQTPVPRILQAEIPVRQAVNEVLVNGKKADFEIKKEVNCCRVIIKSPASDNHKIRILLEPDHFLAEGNVHCILKNTSGFRFSNVELVKVENPQVDFGKVSIKGNEIAVTPEISGKFTLFAELKKGNVSWYHPLELTVKDQWSIVEQYQAWDVGTPAKLLSPAINMDKRILQFQISNNGPDELSGEMNVKTGGMTFRLKVKLPSGQIGKYEVPLKDLPEKLSPGTIPFTVSISNNEKTVHAIAWELPDTEFDKNRIVSLDLRKYCNINIEKLYGNDSSLTWRTDYTGAAVGVDWRDDLTIDKYGYKIMVQPISHINWGVLPEHHNVFTRWIMPELADYPAAPVPFRFIEKRARENNILALINTENSWSLPGGAAIEPERPVTVEKIYLLTANLTKTCKSYYPAAEAEIIYDTGTNQVIQLIPPFNMPSFVQAYCPEACFIPAGKLESTQTFSQYGNNTGVSITDLVTDPGRKIKQIRLRCVSTESVFGIIGICLLPKK